MPPTLHVSGGRYVARPEPDELALLASWLLDRLSAPVDEPVGDWEHRGAAFTEPVDEGQRHDTALSLAGYLRSRSVSLAAAELAMHGWHAERVASGKSFSLDEAMAVLRDVYQRYPAGQVVPQTDDRSQSANAARPAPDPVLWRTRLAAVARTLTEGTEIDPIGVLGELLCAFGVYIGSGPYVAVASDRHRLLIWPLLIGLTNAGRKGQADGAAKALLRHVDADFLRWNRATGLSSGEGLVHLVRDGEPERPGDTKERAARRDPGVPDKRLWVVESEWAAAMIRAGREGSTLTPVLRDAWSGDDLGVLTKSAVRATRPHIGVTGHISPDEFVTRMHAVELSGGTYNRFLPLFVERDCIVPDPPTLDEQVLKGLAFDLRKACGEARKVGAVSRSEDFRSLWADVYEELSADDTSRAVSQFTARAAPQALRIAAVFALTEERREMTAADLECAKALVGYSIASARHVVGATAAADVVERFRNALDAANGEWVSRDHIWRNVFQRHVRRAALDAAWLTISADSRFESRLDQTDGRPSTLYRAQPL